MSISDVSADSTVGDPRLRLDQELVVPDYDNCTGTALEPVIVCNSSPTAGGIVAAAPGAASGH